MTNLFIALIQIILNGRTLKQVFLESMPLYNEPECRDAYEKVWNEYMEPAFITMPEFIVFWYIFMEHDIWPVMSRIIVHKNKTEIKDIFYNLNKMGWTYGTRDQRYGLGNKDKIITPEFLDLDFVTFWRSHVIKFDAHLNRRKLAEAAGLEYKDPSKNV